MTSQSLLSPPASPASPVSPRDHRHFVPRRPSPLSLPPIAPHIAKDADLSFQPLAALSTFALETPKTGSNSKVPRYPLEKQRRAWKEIEDQRQQQQMQKQAPMQVPRANSTSISLSPTSTLALTPRTPLSSASSRYSDHDGDEHQQQVSRPMQRTFCGAVFGPCLGVFVKSTKHIETIHLNQARPLSAR